MRDDVISLIVACCEIAVCTGDFVRLGGLGRPPVQSLTAVFAVVRGCAAECENPLAVNRIDLSAHQMNDVFCIRMHMDSAAEHLCDRLFPPEAVVIVVAVNPEDRIRLLFQKFNPLFIFRVQLACVFFLFLLFLLSVFVEKRQPEITQNHQIVIFTRHSAGAAHILVHELGHINAAVRVAGKVNHDRLFLSAG